MPATAEDLVQIDQLLAQCQHDVSLGNFAQSVRTCKSAIDLLGSSYSDPELIDDTGTKLGLAKVKENEGDLRAASNLYVSALESRLSVARSKPSNPDAKKPK